LIVSVQAELFGLFIFQCTDGLPTERSNLLCYGVGVSRNLDDRLPEQQFPIFAYNVKFQGLPHRATGLVSAHPLVGGKPAHIFIVALLPDIYFPGFLAAVQIFSSSSLVI